MTRERNVRCRRWSRFVRREIQHGRNYEAGFALSGNVTAGSDFYTSRRVREVLRQWDELVLAYPALLDSIEDAEAHPERRVSRPKRRR